MDSPIFVAVVVCVFAYLYHMILKMKEDAVKMKGHIERLEKRTAHLHTIHCIEKQTKKKWGDPALTALTELYLNQNQIADIGPLQHLTALTDLWLQENQIADTDPAVVLLRTRGVTVYL